MKISQRLQKIKPSLTLAVNSRALELKAKGVDIISLAVGEPNFATPKHICEAAKVAIDENFCRYTAVAGIPELRKAAGNYFNRTSGVEVQPDSIIIGNGGKQCLFNYLLSTINQGDEVLIPSPYWLSYTDMVTLADGTPILVHSGIENNFKITPELLDKKATKNTKLLIINTPTNPTGVVYSEKEILAIADWAISKNICIFADEIYNQLIYPPASTVSLITLFNKHPEHIAVLNGVSKTFAMTGWRVGFLATNPNIIKTMSTLQGQSTSNICSIAQKAALAALTGPLDCVYEMKDAFIRRRDLSLEIINTWPLSICPKPDGAFYLFIDVHKCYNNTIKNSTELCTYLLDNANVAVVPGAAFGDDNCIRISYAVSDDALHTALVKIGDCLRKISN